METRVRDGAGSGPAAAGRTTAGLAGRDYLRYPANAPTPPSPANSAPPIEANRTADPRRTHHRPRSTHHRPRPTAPPTPAEHTTGQGQRTTDRGRADRQPSPNAPPTEVNTSQTQPERTTDPGRAHRRPRSTWARSSSGRAPVLQAGGGRFETGRVHATSTPTCQSRAEHRQPTAVNTATVSKGHHATAPPLKEDNTSNRGSSTDPSS